MTKRTEQEQREGLDRLARAANKLHRVNVQMRQGAGDVLEATGYVHGERVSVVYVVGGYDVWVSDPTLLGGLALDQTDLSLEVATTILVEAYMEDKARFVITKTWGMDPAVAERVLSDPWDRKRFFDRMDAGSDKAQRNIAKRHTN